MFRSSYISRARCWALTFALLVFVLPFAACTRAPQPPPSLQSTPVPAGNTSTDVALTAVAPTIFYKWTSAGEAFQVARVDLANAGADRQVDVVARMAGRTYRTEVALPAGGVKGVEVLVPPLAEGATDTLQLAVQEAGTVLAAKDITWQYQRQWKLHIVPFSHVDVGFTNTQADAQAIQELNIDGKVDAAGNPAGALELMRLTDGLPDDSQFRFVSESSWAVSEFLDDPAVPQARKDLLLQRIREGRFEVTGFYCGHTNKFTGDESLVRSTMFAAERLAREYGVDVTTAIINDIGDLSSVATPLAQAGIRYFQHGGNTIQYPLPALFYLRKPTGNDRVLMWRSPSLGGYGEAGDLGISKVAEPVSLDMQVDPSPWEDKIAEHFAWLQSNGLPLPVVKRAYEGGDKWHADYPYDAYLVAYSPPHGGDNGQQDLSASVVAREWNARYAYPRLIVSTSRQFFEYVEQKYASQIPEIPVDFAGFWGEQVFLANSQMDPNKEAKSRQFVERMSAGDAFATFANAIDPAVPLPDRQAVYDAYAKNILLNDHNGVPVKISQNQCPNNMAGGGICYTPEDIPLFKQVRQQWIDEYDGYASTVLATAQAELAKRVRSEDGSARLVVFNPSAWERTDVVEATVPLAGGRFRLLADGTNAVPYQVTGESAGNTNTVFVATVPAYGYRTYVVSPGQPTGTPPLSATTSLLNVEMENEFYRVVVPRFALAADSGKVGHIVDKRTGRDLVNSRGEGVNQYFSMMRSQSSGSGIVGFDLPQEYRPGWVTSTASLVENGPVRARIRVTGTYDFTTFTPPLAFAVFTLFKGEAGVTMDFPFYSPTTVVQDIILYKGINRVEFVQTLEKTPPQVVESTFMYSFEVPKWQELRVEAPYNVVKYGVKDWAGLYNLPPAASGDLAMTLRIQEEVYPWNKQFKWVAGIPTDISFRHFVDLSGPDYGVAFASRDSGLIIPMQPGEMPYQTNPLPKFYQLAVGSSAVGEAITGSQLNATYTVRNAVAAHSGSWNTTDGVPGSGSVARWARAFTAPLTAVWVAGGPGGPLPGTNSFASVDQPGVVMPVVKAAEDGDGYALRLYETAAKPTVAKVSVPFAGDDLTWTLATTGERDLCLLPGATGIEATLRMEPSELLTVRLRNHPVAASLPVCQGR